VRHFHKNLSLPSLKNRDLNSNNNLSFFSHTVEVQPLTCEDEELLSVAVVFVGEAERIHYWLITVTAMELGWLCIALEQRESRIG